MKVMQGGAERGVYGRGGGLVVSDSCDPWTVACQAPLSMRFSRQEYWSGLPFPSSRDLLDPGIELGSPTLQADLYLFSPQLPSHTGCHVTLSRALCAVQ